MRNRGCLWMLAGLIGPLLAAPALGQDISAALLFPELLVPDRAEEVAESAKKFALRYLPTVKELTPAGAWRLPWELPEAYARLTCYPAGDSCIGNEKAYWLSVAAPQGFVGLDEKEAKARLAKRYPGKNDEILGKWDERSLSMLVHYCASQFAWSSRCLYSYAELEWDTRVRVTALAQALQGKSNDPSMIFAPEIQTKLFAHHYEKLTAEQIRTSLINELTLASRQTMLTWVVADSWKSELGPNDSKLKIGRFTCHLRLIDGGRIKEIKDLQERDVAGVQARLARTYASYFKTGLEGSGKILNDKLRRELEAQLTRSFVKVEHLDFGNNSYLIHLHDGDEEPLPILSDSRAFGRVRNGIAVVDIHYRGTLPPAQVQQEMRRLMHLLHNKIRLFHDLD